MFEYCLNTIWTLPEYSIGIAWILYLNTTWILPEYCMNPVGGILPKYCLYLNIDWWLPACCLHAACILSVNGLHTVYILSAYCQHTACILSPYCLYLYTDYILSECYLNLACMLPTYYVDTVWVQYYVNIVCLRSTNNWFPTHFSLLKMLRIKKATRVMHK